MSRSVPTDTLPPTARTIALLLASTPTIQDAQPGVLHQLLEFSHRYTSQVLSDALVYAEHAGRAGKIEMDDIVLAIQARVGWEFGGRVPKEYALSLAAQTNAVPLPSVPEVFGVRLPAPANCLTAVDFDLVPNKPPPGVKLYDEEIEEIEEDEDDFDEGEESPLHGYTGGASMQIHDQVMRDSTEGMGPVSAMQSPSDADMASPEAGPVIAEEGSDAGGGEEDDGLFAGGDDDSDDEGMESVDVPETGLGDAGLSTNGIKRKLVEEEDYD